MHVYAVHTIHAMIFVSVIVVPACHSIGRSSASDADCNSAILP